MVLRITVTGAVGVGKHSLIHRFAVSYILLQLQKDVDSVYTGEFGTATDRLCKAVKVRYGRTIVALLIESTAQMLVTKRMRETR